MGHRAVGSALAFVLVVGGFVRADPPFRFPEGRCPHGELKYVGNVPVLAVDGTPEEMGAAVGRLALMPGKRMAGYPDDVLREFYLTLFRTPLLLAGAEMAGRFPSDYAAEMESMAAAAGIDRDLAVLGNTMFDLKKVVACSAILVEPQRSTTGGTLMGRNLDYPSLGYAHEYTLVTVYRPKGAKHAFAAIGFPGIVGCLSGINDAGLAVAVLEVAQSQVAEKRFDIQGTPYALCYRRLLEECSTIDEALRLLASMKRTGLSNLAVADRTGAAVFEISPERVVVRTAQQGTCVATNHFCSEQMRALVTINWFSTVDRFDALTKVSELQRKLGPTDLHVGLHAACHPTYTLQTMIFDSSSLTVRLGCGKIPSSALELETINLQPYLAGASR